MRRQGDGDMGGENTDMLNMSNGTIVTGQLVLMLLVLTVNMLGLWYLNMAVRTTNFDAEGYEVRCMAVMQIAADDCLAM